MNVLKEFFKYIKALCLAARPKTLTAACVPVWVGSTLAGVDHHPAHFYLSSMTLLSALFIQIGTNFINDVLDFQKGTDTPNRLGPARMTQSGLLSPQFVMLFGLFCFLMSISFAIPLVYVGGWPIVLIGLLSLAAGYLYTGGPYPLAYIGLGDVFVLIFFGWIAVGGVYYLQSGGWSLSAWVAGSQVGLLATVLIAMNNLRDAKTDVQTGKKTLAVRLGEKKSRIEISFLVGIPFLLGAFWCFQHLKWAFLLPLLTLPLAIACIRGVWRDPPGVTYNQFLAKAALLHLLFGGLLGCGLYIGRNLK